VTARPDPEQMRAALLAQTDQVASWLDGLDETAWAAPSVLPGWTVSVLAGHVAGVLREIPVLLSRVSPEAPQPLAHHFPPESAVPDDAERDGEAAAWADTAPAVVRSEFAAAATAARDALADMSPLATVAVSRGPAAVADVLLTRVWELVVHADDLGRSLPDNPPPELDPGAVRVSTRGLADLLVARAPGRSVELRVPPYVAVQCVPGPRHTRGTPPNVVETDPVSWLRLACGRVRWADEVATGAVRASGERSDLSAYLPLLG
jgi:uncharacterized protein (TIGR03083 family)